MARFQAPTKPKVGSRPTVNLAGSAAFDRDPREALASMVLTSMVQDTHYQSAEEQLETVRALVAANDPLFVAKTALYARHEHGLRSISHVLAGEIAQLKDVKFSRAEFFRRIVFRLDDMSEIVGYWILRYGTGKKKTLPNAMKRGFADVLESAKPDMLAKWGNGSPSLRQVAHLCHPKGETAYALRGGKLASADTHEVALTAAGSDANAKAGAWADLFARGKVRYLAALRNARNIIEKAPASVDALCAVLESEKDVRASKVFPFQFLAAHDAVSSINGPLTRRVLSAIEVGADLALSNVPKLEGATLVCLDDSGSMMTATQERHKKPAVIGAMFASALARSNHDCDVMLFDEDARYVALSPTATLFGSIETLLSRLVPKGTNFHAPFQLANRPYARIIILSDTQGWMGGSTPEVSLRDYEARHGCKPFIYSWDLVGSTTSQFPAPRIAALAGRSDRVFDVMKSLETDPKALIHAIEEIKL